VDIMQIMRIGVRAGGCWFNPCYISVGLYIVI